jgi:hypothetical protein
VLTWDSCSKQSRWSQRWRAELGRSTRYGDNTLMARLGQHGVCCGILSCVSACCATAAGSHCAAAILQRSHAACAAELFQGNLVVGWRLAAGGLVWLNIRTQLCVSGSAWVELRRLAFIVTSSLPCVFRLACYGVSQSCVVRSYACAALSVQLQLRCSCIPRPFLVNGITRHVRVV